MTVRGYLDLFSTDSGVDTGVRIISADVSPRMPVSDRDSFALDTLEALRGGDPNARIDVIEGGLLDNRDSWAAMPPDKDGV